MPPGDQQRWLMVHRQLFEVEGERLQTNPMRKREVNRDTAPNFNSNYRLIELSLLFTMHVGKLILKRAASPMDRCSQRGEGEGRRLNWLDWFLCSRCCRIAAGLDLVYIRARQQQQLHAALYWWPRDGDRCRELELSHKATTTQLYHSGFRGLNEGDKN